MPPNDLTPHMTTWELFPSVVQVSTHPAAARINAELRGAVANIRATTPNGKPQDWAGNLYTTVENNNELQLHPSFKEISNFIENECANFASINKLFISNDGVFIKNLWVNIYTKNNSMDVHNHPNSLFTGVYFLKVPENSAKFAFDSPNSESMVSTPINKISPYNQYQPAFEANEGELIVFNSYLKHRVLLHDIEEERISIGFTVII
jgi:uncharacterized protein (TIGR02466 family)